MSRLTVAIGFSAALMIGLSACTTASTPAAEKARDHEIACLAGTVGGALVGAAAGSLFGGGLGKDILMGAGGGVGAVEGRRLACGK